MRTENRDSLEGLNVTCLKKGEKRKWVSNERNQENTGEKRLTRGDRGVEKKEGSQFSL